MLNFKLGLEEFKKTNSETEISTPQTTRNIFQIKYNLYKIKGNKCSIKETYYINIKKNIKNI